VQSEVSRNLPPNGILVNALSVIADPQLELSPVVTNLHCDSPRLRVPEGVTQRFAGDAVCLVTHDRVQPARRTFYFEINDGRFDSSRIPCEFFGNGPYSVGKIIGFERRRAQALHRVTTFGNRLSRLLDCAIKPLPGVVWTLWQEFRSRLEPQQQALKTLKQSVVQFARNARALAHSRLQSHVELVRELPDTELISRPEQDQ
jgi:hypothetical protein